MMKRSAVGQQARRLGSAGQAIVEFALITPLLLFLTVGLVDASRAFWAYTSLQNVASEGARRTVTVLFPTASQPVQCLVGGAGGNTDVIVQAAVAEASALGFDTSDLSGAAAPLTNASFSLTVDDINASATLCTPPGTTITFQASYTFQPLVSMMLGQGSILMTAQSTMQIE
jgi:hypothetical protein